MKSAEQSIIEFLKNNPSKYASAHLQRMLWKNKNGTNATPRSIVRRLEENTCTKENPLGILEVSYDEHNNAWYQIKAEHKAPILLREHIVYGDGRRSVRDLQLTNPL